MKSFIDEFYQAEFMRMNLINTKNPNTLFKFTEKQYMDNFFETGSLRLGTIYDFKDIIQYQMGIGDSDEGSHLLHRSIKESLSLTKDSNEEIISEALSVANTVHPATIKNFTVIVPRHTQDRFIFCTSKDYSDSLFKKWNEKYREINACYIITDAKKFADAISKVIKESVFFESRDDIIYTNKTIPYDSLLAKIDPAITKEKQEFSWQNEHRMTWYRIAPYTPIKPWIINVPDAREFCKPYFILSNSEVIIY
ncbi:hypothetical protein I7V30_11760 [Lelliottia amnigena]|uniref:hypothetical protein n=1 Tax=Lelliottia amnigena TaxID=61646 RepID=UPI00192AF0FC|nr:hypothetical protein [Lelliottia amnigena]MBL5965938.1 hypothetical protein [Lelliottia amnigena]